MPRPITEINAQHLDQMRAWHDGQPGRLNWASVGYRAMLAHYYNLLIPSEASVLEIGCGSGELLKRIRAKRKVGIDLSEKQVSRAREACPGAEFHVQAAEELSLEERFDVVVISDTLNFSADVQKVLERVHAVSHPRTRLIINYPSAVWRPALALARSVGLKPKEPPSNWLATSDIIGLMELADWSPLVIQPRIICPVVALGVGPFLNRWLSPLLPWFCLSVFCVARSTRKQERVP